jgi:hypothetical protein
MSDVTQLIAAAAGCARQAAADLLPLVYDELRQLAAARLVAEAPGHTEGEHVLGKPRRHRLGQVRVQPLPIAAASESVLATGALNQDAAHRFSRGGEEVPPTIPVLRLVHIDEADVGLMDQRRRLQGLTRLLLRQPLGRKLA